MEKLYCEKCKKITTQRRFCYYKTRCKKCGHDTVVKKE